MNKYQNSRLSTGFKALRQLGFSQVALNLLYKFGLASGHYRRITSRGESLTRPITCPRPIAPLPSREQILNCLGEIGLQKLLTEAAEIADGKIRLFCGDPVPLDLCPTGPLAHWTAYESGIFGSHVPFGRTPCAPTENDSDEDIKNIWEPARFGWAFVLGRAYHVSGDETYAAAFWRLFEDFNSANPPNLGPNWMSGQEVGLRLIAFIWAAQIFSPSEHSSLARMQALSIATANHAARIPCTLPYARSQNNNHLLTESAALVTASLALPGHPDAESWLKTGRHWLSWCFTRQIDASGEYVQHSANYQRLMLQTALWINAITSRTDLDLTPKEQILNSPEREKLALAAGWLLARLDPESGSMPNLGANDGALIFPFSTCDFADYHPVAQAAARAFLPALPKTDTLTQPSDTPAGAWDEMSLWFGLPRDVETPAGTHSVRPAGAFGQIYANNSWASLRAVQYTSRPSHADQLHCDLWWRGLNIAQDAGTYRYNAEAPWDNRLTSTLVHNTVSVNGNEQMTRAGRFLYLDWAAATFKEQAKERAEYPNTQRVSAQTDAYASKHVRHERTVTVSSEDCWLVEDKLINTSIPKQKQPAPVYRLHWLLPDWEWKLEHTNARAILLIKSPHGWASLTISTDQPIKRVGLLRAGELIDGDALVSPVFGWCSPTYSVKKPALSLAVEVQSSHNVTFHSEFVFPGIGEAQALPTAWAGFLKLQIENRKLHILLIHQAFAAIDEAGGTRHYELARFLVQKGHLVTVIASPVSYLTGTSSHKQKEVIEGVTILRAATYNALHKSFIHRIFAFLSFMVSSFFIGRKIENVDIVWGTSPPIFQGLSAWSLARLKGAKFLFEVRDLWPSFAIAVGVLKNPILIKMSLWLESFLYRHADRIIVNSPGYVKHVHQRRGSESASEGVPLHSPDLVPNGADPSMFDPLDNGSSFRQANHITDKFVVLYAGAHGMSNNLEVVLECASLLASNPIFQFVLLGDGKEKAALQARAAKMGLKNVLFLPSVPKNEMTAALAGAQACIAILKPIEAYKTTYPNKVFDYMAAGRPVILAIEGVIREAVEAADCGVFPRPGDAQDMANAIQFLESDREHTAILGLHGREYLEKYFNREHSAEKLCGILEEMADT